jgi:Ca2+-dependent lipid-binding protein
MQVCCARGLRAADSNGLSDPYVIVAMGGRSEQTRVVPECLDPDWNEAFAFSADEVDDMPLLEWPALRFEVWDSDVGLVADDFLGQVGGCLLWQQHSVLRPVLPPALLLAYMCGKSL